jgi:hypothetical protein
MGYIMFNNKYIEKYVIEGFNNVEGWCDPKVAEIIDMFDSLPLNKEGGACEIGIHHGKLFLLLNQAIEEQYKSYAVDVFDFQHLNIDNSGEGKKDMFIKNVLSYDRHLGNNIVVLEEDSTDPKDALRKNIPAGSLRFMSVDGGHTVEHTINDLKIASELISNEGIVIVDDITNHWWMSVVEGVCKYLLNYPTLIPIAIGQNKLYMCKLSWHDYYFTQINMSRFRTKESKFFGHNLISF